MNDMDKKILMQIIEANAEKIRAYAAFKKLSKSELLGLKNKFLETTKTK